MDAQSVHAFDLERSALLRIEYFRKHRRGVEIRHTQPIDAGVLGYQRRAHTIPDKAVRVRVHIHRFRSNKRCVFIFLDYTPIKTISMQQKNFT